jgi:hypothetical protein
LAELTDGGRLSAAEIRGAVQGYGKTLVPLPPDARRFFNATPIGDASVPQWSLVQPLFTAEEGRSDLLLELTAIEVAAGSFRVELDDIHAL